MIDWRVQPESPPRERKPEVAAAVKTGLHFNGREVCKPHNDPRGCTREESQCPNKRAHVCDALNEGGKVCGSMAHTRSQHIEGITLEREPSFLEAVTDDSTGISKPLSINPKWAPGKRGDAEQTSREGKATDRSEKGQDYKRIFPYPDPP